MRPLRPGSPGGPAGRLRQALTDAYAKAEPLKALLNQHRRLALSKSPLGERIEVMRSLAQADPKNPIWEEDLRTFESARLRDLFTETTSAVRARDRYRVAQLLKEVSSGGWRTPVPMELKTGLESALAAYRAEDALVEARSLLTELDSAYSAMDYDACVRLSRQVRQLAAAAGAQLDRQVAEQVQGVEHWIAEQDQRRQAQIRFETACARLAQAIDLRLPTEELEQRRRAAVVIDPQLPEELSRRVRDELSRRAESRRRRIRFTVAGCILTAAAIALLVGLFVRAQANERRRKDLANRFESLVLANKLQEAADFWDGLTRKTPELLDGADMRVLKETLDRKLGEERDRIADFRAAMDLLKARTAETIDARALAAVESKAKTPAEKQEIADFQKRSEEARRAAEQRAAKAWRDKLTGAQEQVRQLEAALAAGGLTAPSPQLDDAEAALSTLSKNAAAGAQDKATIENLAQRVASVKATLEQAGREASALAKVRASANSAATLKAALEQYMKQEPTSARVADFRRAVADAPAWESVEAWAAASRGWAASLLPAGAEPAGRIKAMEAYATKFPQSPFDAAINDYRAYLTQAARAIQPDGPLKGDLRRVFAAPLIADLKCLKRKGAEGMYYLPPDSKWKPAMIGDRIVSVECDLVLTSDASARKSQVLKTGEYDGEPAPSPQSLLAADLLKRIDAVSDKQWESAGLDLIALIHSNKEIDPLLKIILLDRTIKFGQRAGWGWGDDLKAYGEKLTAINADDLAWMNPDDPAAAAARAPRGNSWPTAPTSKRSAPWSSSAATCSRAR